MDTTTITGGPLRPHEYVLVKTSMTAGDERYIQNAGAKVEGTGPDAQMRVTMGDIQFAMAQRVIVGWSLTKTEVRPDGTSVEMPIPFSVQAIEDLDRKVYRYLVKEIDKLFPAEDDAAFLKSASGQSGDNSSQTNTSH